MQASWKTKPSPQYAELAEAFTFERDIELYIVHRKTVRLGFPLSQG